MIVDFPQYPDAECLSRLVRARSPFRARAVRALGKRASTALGMAWDIEEIKTFIADIETRIQKGVPVLLKQYLKLGGALLAFNVKRQFSNALDGLIVVDLVKTDPRLLDNVLRVSRACRRSFLSYHQERLAKVH